MHRFPSRMLLILLLIPLPVGAAPTVASTVPSLTVYTYDSFAGKDSLGAWIADEFQKKEHIRTRYVVFGSAGEALNQVALEGKGSSADLVVGIDNSLLARALSTGHFVAGAVDLMPSLRADLQFDATGTFIPFDFGFLAFVYDSRRIPQPAQFKNLSEIAASAALRGKIVIEDPRTSSVGLGLLIWSAQEFAGEKWPNQKWDDFWRQMQKQWISVAPGWSGAYGMFLKGEADYVLSYTTSPAYHTEKEKNDAYRAVIFPSGNYRQVEAAGIVKYSRQLQRARRWLSFLLSPEVQARVASHQWMYPARKGVVLPSSFQKIEIPKVVSLSPDAIEKGRAFWINRWTEISSGREPHE